MAKFLCITLNPAIDVTISLTQLHIGAVNRAQAAQSRPAGKGLNVASVLHGLGQLYGGHDIWVTGFLGHNNHALFDEEFNQRGYHNHFVYVDGDTRQNIKIAETAPEFGGRMTDINGKGLVIDDNAKQVLLDKITTLASHVDFVVLSGSLPQNFSLDDFATLIQTIQHINPKLAIDSSGDALTTAVKHQPFLLKPNHDELYESFGLPANSVDEQRQLVATLGSQTPHWVISLGEQGVNWLSGQPTKQLLNAKPPKVTVESTVAAGDTLLAGILHGMATGLTTAQTLTLATALASHTVSQVGCEVPTASRLDELMRQVVLTDLI